MENFILFGPPGGGKDRTAKEMVKKYNLEQISTGNIFRDHISRKTALGLQVNEIMKNGKLVPDEIVNNMVKEYLAERTKNGKTGGYILDGYPRTIEQAKALSEFARIDAVITFQISVETAIKRVTNRRVCECCSKTYFVNNSALMPKVEGICDIDGKKLFRRNDDTELVVRKRYADYIEKEGPILDYYKKQDRLHIMEFSPEIEADHNWFLRETYKRIDQIISDYQKKSVDTDRKSFSERLKTTNPTKTASIPF